MNTKVVFILAILMNGPFHSALIYGQDSIRKSIPVRQLSLNGESGEREITLPLRDTLTYINFEIKAIINNGELSVELFDPNGEKYGNFSIAGSATSTNKQDNEIVRGKMYDSNASGSLVRYVKYPMPGLWKAKLITKDAFGLISFNLTRGVTVFSIR